MAFLITPTADLKLTYTPVPGTSTLQVDFALTSTGDLALVAGSTKLVQDIIRWLLTPQGGNPFDPDYGNPLYSLLGRPNRGDSTLFENMMTQAQTAFLVYQQQEIESNQLTLDEQVDQFTNLQVSSSAWGPGFTLVSFTVVSKSGTQTPIIVPVPIGG